MLEKNILLAVANGIEELEAVTIIDVLRRANVGVRIASIEEREICGANGIKIIADSEFSDEVIENYDAIVLPGGSEGAKRFQNYPPLINALKGFMQKGQLIAAICASPALVFAHHGLLDSKKATCYPSFRDQIKNFVNERLVIDHNVVTSQGPGTALLFALSLARLLSDEKTANAVKNSMLA